MKLMTASTARFRITMLVKINAISNWDRLWDLQDGAPKIAKLPYFSGFMVDITMVNGGYMGL